MRHLTAARYQPNDKPMYSAVEVKDTIVVTPISHHGLTPATTCSFPTVKKGLNYRFNELVMQEDETRKSGCHDPVGLLAFYGNPIRKNYNFGSVSIPDIGPSLLFFLGVAVPQYMKGVIREDVLVKNKEPAMAS